jgi:YbbR domain-containing protein
LYSLLAEKMFATTQLKSYSPDKIEINYSLLMQKELSVTISGTVSPAFGYIFSDSIRIEPAQIVAYGSQNKLDTLREIQTIPLDYNDINRDWTITAGLQAPEGIRLSVGEVELSVAVEAYTEKTFELPVICYNMPANRRVHFFPSTVELSVNVGLSKYSQLSKSNFEIAVDYNDLITKNSANYSLTLSLKPSWIESYRIVPEGIEFLIEQKND